MRRICKSLLIMTVIGCFALPRTARAEGYFFPWGAAQYGKSIGTGRGAFGVAAGGMGAGIVGGEVNFGYSPSFFGTQNDFGHNTVLDLMGNVIVGIPIGGIWGPSLRPYVTGGLGLIRTQIDGGTLFTVQSSNNRFGWDAGFGLMGFFNDHVGLRGDIRYLQYAGGNVENGIDLGQLHYWRTALGVVIR